MIPAFLHVKLKKNAETISFGVLHVKSKRKTPELMIPAFLHVESKKKRRNYQFGRFYM